MLDMFDACNLWVSPNSILKTFHHKSPNVKGKLAHNFMVSYLVLISCISDMVRTVITEKNAKIDVIHIYREKKIKFRNL